MLFNMEHRDYFIGQYKFDDFFNKTAAMLKYTWKEILFVIAIVLIPLAALTAFGIVYLYNLFEPIVTQIIQGKLAWEDMDFSRLLPLLLQFTLWFSAFFLVYWLADIIINASISQFVFNKVKGDVKPFKEVMLTVLTQYLSKLVLQSLLVSLILLGIMAGFGIIVGVAVAISILAKLEILGTLIIVFASLGLIVLLIWLFNRLAFGLQALVYEKLGAVESLKKSHQLVMGNWWRVWGLLILAGLIISFASSMITGPIVSGFMLPTYAKVFGNILRGDDNILEIYENMLAYLPRMWLPILAASLIQGVLYYCILPVFRSLFYIDLKVRKNELNKTPPE